MKRRDFLARTAAGVSASLLLGNLRSDGYRFVGSVLAAGEGDRDIGRLKRSQIDDRCSILDRPPGDRSPIYFDRDRPRLRAESQDGDDAGPSKLKRCRGSRFCRPLKGLSLEVLVVPISRITHR